MSVLMKGLQPILRCKHCQQFPKTSTIIEKSPAWNGTTVDLHKVTVQCPSEPAFSYTYSGVNKRYVAQHVYYVWNTSYGAKP
jgi:hypothetical protein